MALVGAAVVASACARLPLDPPPPEPTQPPPVIRTPQIRVAAPDLESLEPVGYLLRPEGEEIVDELLASPLLRAPEFQEALGRWIDHWQHTAAPWFSDFVRRMGRYELTVDSALAARRLPPSLRYLPLIESGYDPSARSHASAVGMWQFMPLTARELGMEVGAFVDERRDPFVSTALAVDFLDRLHTEFDSWFLALAAYNGGPSRTRRILRRHAPLAQPSDSLFWALRDHWPRETREFVPKLVGAILVAQHPMRYGYAPLELDDPVQFDEVEVPDGTTFDVLAGAAGVDVTEVRRLNPQLYRGFTPPGRATTVRIPEGTATAFASNYARIPADRRMTVVEHAVTAGETLSHIAVRYGVSVADLQEANPGLRPRALRVGARVTVPVGFQRDR